MANSKQVARKVKKVVDEVSASGRVATSSDVARLAGVSRAAVSVVLRGKTDSNISVSEPVQAKIRDAARMLGYRPIRAARTMRARRTNMIGFLSSNYTEGTRRLGNHLVYPFVVGLNHALAARDHHVTLVEVNELEFGAGGAVPKLLQEFFFDGLVVHMGLSERAREQVRDTRLPVVYYDSGVFEAERCLYRDERATGRAAVGMLAARGHRRIGFFHTAKHWHRFQEGTLDHHSYGHRVEGFTQALAEMGERARHLVAESPEKLAEQIRADGLTGVVVTGGLPVPLMQALGLAGLAIPRDVSVVSCDVEGRLRPVDGFGLGGVINDRFASGERAAEMILSLIEEPNGRLSSVVVPPETREGDSVAVARASGDAG